MLDNYVYIIVALLPLCSLILVLQKNPYQALVIRAILGAIAALTYVVLGGADVALTEALVGTMLAVTLYIIAVRSSLVMRLGIVRPSGMLDQYEMELVDKLKKIANNYYLRLEITEYKNTTALEKALSDREIHLICFKAEQNTVKDQQIYHTVTRIKRLFQIIETELVFPETTLSLVPLTNLKEK